MGGRVFLLFWQLPRMSTPPDSLRKLFKLGHPGTIALSDKRKTQSSLQIRERISRKSLPSPHQKPFPLGNRMFSPNINTPSSDLSTRAKTGQSGSLSAHTSSRLLLPSTGGPSAEPGRSGSTALVKNNSPAQPHKSRNFPRARRAVPFRRAESGIRRRARDEEKRVKRMNAESGRQKLLAPRWLPAPEPSEQDGAMEPPAWAPRLSPGDPHLPTRLLWEATPTFRATEAVGGREGLAGGSEPPRLDAERNAVGVRGTKGSQERCAPEWRRRPAGLTDAPAAPHEWGVLGWSGPPLPPRSPLGSRRPRRSGSCLTSQPRRPREEQN